MVWSDIRAVLLRAAGMKRRWRVLCREADTARLEEAMEAPEQKARESPRIVSSNNQNQGTTASFLDQCPLDDAYKNY